MVKDLYTTVRRWQAKAPAPPCHMQTLHLESNPAAGLKVRLRLKAFPQSRETAPPGVFCYNTYHMLDEREIDYFYPSHSCFVWARRGAGERERGVA